ncbi:NERD domain-containing protein [Acinetobacter sp. ANC 5380]|uniref:NERD domain-containing protein n=1 Tax=Acinetobacter terrae TaxID=2731247 RepID=A0A7Y2RG24_9GAMM|nr:nuclease-related domain-containing protein [Acinetobacter terrae]NNH78042.1 NERD domain-containing protein [Acinetobacter terrae]
MENIFAPLYSAIGWMLFIGILLGAFKTFLPMIKGKLGEKYVRDDFNRYFVEPYILINDITLPDNQSTTTQVDHIVISPFGIFVIETKNYKGWIFGSERQKQWTQSIYRQKNKFQNPIHQNYKHIKTLESLLEDIVPSNVFFGIVIFVGSAEFKSKIPKGVFLDRDWIKYIRPLS